MSTDTQRPLVRDRQRKTPKGGGKKVRLARMQVEYGQTGEARAVCSCGGFDMYHKRAKVVDRRAQGHVDKKHAGQALWF